MPRSPGPRRSLVDHTRAGSLWSAAERRRGDSGDVNRFLSAIVSWLRAGYPEGVPATDYQPLFALLSGRLSHDEVKQVARELLNRPDIDDADIGAEIIRRTDELPSPGDIERVRERLAAKGWPLDDPRDLP